MYSHKSIKMKYVSLTRVWHNVVFICKPVWSWNLVLVVGWGLCVWMWVERLMSALCYFHRGYHAVSFLVNCCQHYSGAVPCMWLCLLTCTLSAPSPAASLGRSQSSIDWKRMSGCCCFTLCFSCPYKYFLVLPSAGLWLLHQKIIFCCVTILCLYKSTELWKGKLLFIKTLNTRIKCSYLDELGVNLVF